jgi:hypothetical protein
MSIAQRNGVRIVAVSPHLFAVLRSQTLAVLEFNHHPFEELRELSPAEQLAAAALFRDAFAVLDAIGWESDPDPLTVDVPLTDNHVEQLRRCRADLLQSIRDRRAARSRLASVDSLRDDERRNRDDRTAVAGIDEVLAIYQGT